MAMPPIVHSDNTECIVCAESFNNRRRRIDCPFCTTNTNVCITCSEKYLLDSFKSPHCMLCNHEWNLSFLLTVFPKTFVHNKYRKNRQDKAMEREIGMLPEAVLFIQTRERNRKRQEDLKVLKIQYNNLRKVMRELPNVRGDIFWVAESKLAQKITNLQRQHEQEDAAGTNSMNSTHNTYVCRCPVGVCRGMVSSSDYKCVVCESKVCNRCFVCVSVQNTQHIQTHTCKKEDLASVEQIKKDSKLCPGCANRVFRIQGCDQMFCVYCRTPFNWRTGKKTTGPIHNPHHAQLVRRLGLGSVGTTNNITDNIDCNGVPSYNSIWNVTWDLGDEIGDILYQYYELYGEVHDYLSSNKIRIKDTLDIRVLYVDGKIDDDAFKKRLFIRERRNERVRETRNILETFRILVAERLVALVKDCRDAMNKTDSNGAVSNKNSVYIRTTIVQAVADSKKQSEDKEKATECVICLDALAKTVCVPCGNTDLANIRFLCTSCIVIATAVGAGYHCNDGIISFPSIILS